LKEKEEELKKANEELDKAKEEIVSKDDIISSLDKNIKILKEENKKASVKRKQRSPDYKKPLPQNLNHSVQGKSFSTYDSSEIYLKHFPKTNSNLAKTNSNSFPKNQFASYFSTNSYDFTIKKGIRNKSTKTAIKSSLSNVGSTYKKPSKKYKKVNPADQSYHSNSKSSDISILKDSSLINLKNIQFKAWKKGIFKQRLNYNNAAKNIYGYKSGDLITIKQLRKANTDAPLDYKSKDQMYS